MGTYYQSEHYRAPLLKRLNALQHQRVSHSDVVAYVAESLAQLLNSRQGSVAASLRYGLPDFNELTHTPSQLLRMLERVILSSIEIYEPRLKQVKVFGMMDEDMPDRMRFSISGLLSFDKESYRVNYQSILTPGGRVIVRN